MAEIVYTAQPGQFTRSAGVIRSIAATATTGAIREAAEIGKAKGRANIAAAGFSRKWQNALRAEVYPSRGIALDPAAFFHHNIMYAGVFEYGATISGSPLMWLPLPTAPKTIRGKKMTPALYIQTIGPLVFMRRAGKGPLLGAYMEGAGAITVPKLIRGARRAKSLRPGAPAGRLTLVPLFFGINSVTVGKHFALMEVFKETQAMLPALYAKNLKVT